MKHSRIKSAVQTFFAAWTTRKRKEVALLPSVIGACTVLTSS